MSGILGRRKNFARGLLLSVQLLSAHRLRTLLSISGLLVGVAAVMVMVAIGKGAEQQLLGRMRAMGTDLVVVSATPAPRIAARERQVAVNTLLRPDDAQALVAESPYAIAAAPAVNRATVLRWQGLNRATMLTGTTAEGLRIRNIQVAAGRLFDEADDRARERVIVLGPIAARNLFAGVDPIGRIVNVGNLRFEVIGVAASRGVDAAGTDLDDFAMIPFQTAMRRVLNVAYVHSIFVQAKSSAHLQGLERDIREILLARQGSRSGMNAAFTVQNQMTLLRTERGTAETMSQLVIAVSGIALLLGAIGILTVMLMSVRERTREIGLRRAIGATRIDIHIQFLSESAMLGGAGGATGVIVGLAAAFAAAMLGPWDLVLPYEAALAGFLSSVVLGVAVGVVPAARAARLEPIAALRAA